MFLKDKIVRSVVLVLVTENLRNFQENIRMAQYVSYADSGVGLLSIYLCFRVFSGPSVTDSGHVVPRFCLYKCLLWSWEDADSNIDNMAIFNFQKRKCERIHQHIDGCDFICFCFTMKVGDIQIKCKSILEPEPLIVIPSYDPRLGRFCEIGYGEQDFVDDIQEIIEIIDHKDMGEYAFYNAFDVYVMKHIKKYGRLIDTDLFRIIAELILMMQFFAIKSRMQFSDDDRVGITQTFVNRGLEKFSNVFYVTRYRRIGFELEPSIEKYLK